MNEELTVSSGNTQEHTPDSLGQILKAAREAKNLSIAEVATALHLRPSIVTNIEADDFTHIANATYIRGYVKNFARIVEADKQKVALCLERQAPLVTEQPMQSFSRKTVRQARDTRYHLLTWLVVIGLLVLMVFWWLQTSKFFDNGSVDFSKPTVEEVAAAKSAAKSSEAQSSIVPSQREIANSTTDSNLNPVTEQPAIDSNTAANSQTAVTTQGGDPIQTATPAAQAETLPSVNVSGNTETNVPVKPQASHTMTAAEILAADAALRAPKPAEIAAQQAQVDDGVEDLRVTFTADCWIQVKDGDGKVLISEVRKPGQDLTLTGKAPLSLILGAPGAVSISFNNEAVSMDEFPKSKVARFNLPRNG